MNYIINKEQYLAAKQAWKQTSQQFATDLIIYNAIRGFDLPRGFTPIRNSAKLANGAWPTQSFDNAKHIVQRRLVPPKYSDPADPRAAARIKMFEDSLTRLLKSYGQEFSFELAEKLREALK